MDSNAPGQPPHPGLQVEGLDLLLDNARAFPVETCKTAAFGLRSKQAARLLLRGKPLSKQRFHEAEVECPQVISRVCWLIIGFSLKQLEWRSNCSRD